MTKDRIKQLEAEVAGWKASAENRLEIQRKREEQLAAAQAERDELKARLENLQLCEKEPVAYRAWFDEDHGARWLFTIWPEEEKLGVTWEPLYRAAISKGEK